MAFELRAIGRQKVLYNSANASNPLIAQLVVDGAKVTPTSATITIYKRGNSTALVSAADMTVSGTLLTYDVDTTTTSDWPVETGYRAEVTVTYNGETYQRTLVFDVVKFLLDLAIGVDQLVALDDRVDGMRHGTYDDLAPLIVACRDYLQARLESKAVKDDKLVENMIIDHSAVATAARFYILAQLFFEKGNTEAHDKYRKDFEELFEQVLASVRYDTGQDGDEDSEVGGYVAVRFVT